VPRIDHYEVGETFYEEALVSAMITDGSLDNAPKAEIKQMLEGSIRAVATCESTYVLQIPSKCWKKLKRELENKQLIIDVFKLRSIFINNLSARINQQNSIGGSVNNDQDGRNRPVIELNEV